MGYAVDGVEFPTLEEAVAGTGLPADVVKRKNKAAKRAACRRIMTVNTPKSAKTAKYVGSGANIVNVPLTELQYKKLQYFACACSTAPETMAANAVDLYLDLLDKLPPPTQQLVVTHEAVAGDMVFKIMDTKTMEPFTYTMKDR